MNFLNKIKKFSETVFISIVVIICVCLLASLWVWIISLVLIIVAFFVSVLLIFQAVGMNLKVTKNGKQYGYFKFFKFYKS